METIAERLESALDCLRRTASEVNRAPDSVQLLAVSKTKPVSDIIQAYNAGQRLFGENYVQEGVEKIEVLQELSDIEWHFIGPLQSNKTQLVADHFDWVQSVSRVKIARRLHQQRSPFNPLNICIQVNINDETGKAGVAESEVMQLAEQISEFDRLRLRGLMTIPAAEQSVEQLRSTFARMRTLFEQLKSIYSQVDTLSMGMSQDMIEAVKAGSTMVRAGTAIFGPREK